MVLTQLLFLQQFLSKLLFSGKFLNCYYCTLFPNTFLFIFIIHHREKRPVFPQSLHILPIRHSVLQYKK